MTNLVRGTAVVSLADGTTVGEVDRVLLDPERQEIVGFSIRHRSGIFGSKCGGLIDVSDIHALGSDAVTIDSIGAVRSDLVLSESDHSLIDLDDLLKRSVITTGGTEIGQIVGIRFSQNSFRLLALDVCAGFFPDQHAIPARLVVRIGDELVIVDDAVTNPELMQSEPTPLVRVA